MWIDSFIQRVHRPTRNVSIERTIQVDNAQLKGKKVSQILDYLGYRCKIISILRRENLSMYSATLDMSLCEGDQLLISASKDDMEAVKALIGKEI